MIQASINYKWYLWSSAAVKFLLQFIKSLQTSDGSRARILICSLWIEKCRARAQCHYPRASTVFILIETNANDTRLLRVTTCTSAHIITRYFECFRETLYYQSSLFLCIIAFVPAFISTKVIFETQCNANATNQCYSVQITEDNRYSKNKPGKVQWLKSAVTDIRMCPT